MLLCPQPVHDLELLGEHREPRGGLRERETVGAVLALHPTGAEAELDAAAGDVVDGRSGVREEPRQAKGCGRDERAEAQLGRACGEAGKRRPGVVRDVAALVRLRDVVVGTEERVDPVLLARVGECAPLRPGDALLALDHQRDAHRAILRASSNVGRQSSVPNSMLVTPR
jgi:hypothetical protein